MRPTFLPAVSLALSSIVAAQSVSLTMQTDTPIGVVATAGSALSGTLILSWNSQAELGASIGGNIDVGNDGSVEWTGGTGCGQEVHSIPATEVGTIYFQFLPVDVQGGNLVLSATEGLRLDCIR